MPEEKNISAIAEIQIGCKKLWGLLQILRIDDPVVAVVINSMIPVLTIAEDLGHYKEKRHRDDLLGKMHGIISDITEKYCITAEEVVLQQKELLEKIQSLLDS